MSQNNGNSITQNAVCLIVKIKSVGATRKIPTSHIEVDADKDRVGASKSLLKSDELAAIKSRDGFGRHWLYSHSIANEIISSGVYLVKLTAVADVDVYMKQWQADRDKLVSALCNVYPSLVVNDQKTLRSEFNPDDYPGVRIGSNGKIQVSKEALGHEFSLDYEFKSFVTPESLKNVSVEFYEQAKAKEQARVTSIANEVIFGVKEEAKKLVSHLVEKLTPTAEGKQKVLHTSSVEKVQDFLSTFESCKNLGDDQQLSALIKTLRSSMSGVTKDQLKAQEPLRDAIRKDFEKASTQLDQLLVDKPKRVFSFDEVA